MPNSKGSVPRGWKAITEIAEPFRFRLGGALSSLGSLPLERVTRKGGPFSMSSRKAFPVA